MKWNNPVKVSLVRHQGKPVNHYFLNFCPRAEWEEAAVINNRPPAVKRLTYAGILDGTETSPQKNTPLQLLPLKLSNTVKAGAF